MSISVASPSPVESSLFVPELEALKGRAGGVTVSRAGVPVTISYGSAAGELAAVSRGAGIADCSHLAKLELRAPAAELRAVVSDLAGGPVEPGGARCAGGVWWCAAAAERVLALAEWPIASRLRDRLRAFRTQRPALRIADRSREWAAIAVLGRDCGLILDALGVYGHGGDPRLVSPVTAGTVGEVAAIWLLQSDHRALALIAREDARAAWTTLERVGRPVGIARVGQDALQRYALLERRGLPQP